LLTVYRKIAISLAPLPCYLLASKFVKFLKDIVLKMTSLDFVVLSDMFLIS